MDALSATRKRLEARVADPKVMMLPGLKDDLRAVMSAFDELERRTAALAAFMLRSHFDITKHRAQLEAMAQMGAEPANVLRMAVHGHDCTCTQCMRNR